MGGRLVCEHFATFSVPMMQSELYSSVLSTLSQGIYITYRLFCCWTIENCAIVCRTNGRAGGPLPPQNTRAAASSQTASSSQRPQSGPSTDTVTLAAGSPIPSSMQSPAAAVLSSAKALAAKSGGSQSQPALEATS